MNNKCMKKNNNFKWEILKKKYQTDNDCVIIIFTLHYTRDKTNKKK